MTALGELKIEVNQTLAAGTGTWNLSWADGTNRLADISQMVTGANHTLALKSDGTRVYAWGGSLYGQSGDNTNGTDRLGPQEVLGLGGTGYLGEGTNRGRIPVISAGGKDSKAEK